MSEPSSEHHAHPARCAEVARDLSEPLAGTGIKNARLWLCIEDRTAWPPKAFRALDASAQAAIEALEKRTERALPDAKLRIQGIRRPRRDPQAPLRLYVADGLTRRAWALDVPDYAALDRLDLAPALSGELPAARPLEEPLFLVCMHTRRDVCCALYGAPVVARLEEVTHPEQVWQTTHVGGHRFAANIVTLPSGLCYGHIAPGEVAELVAAERTGQVFRPADRLRGRALYPRPVQFADAWLRTRLELTALDAVEVVGWEKRNKGQADAHVEVVLQALGERHTVRVAQLADPVERVVSCGEKPETVEVYTALEA